MKVSPVLARALDAEMSRSRDLRLQLVVCEAAAKHLQVVLKERDALKEGEVLLQRRIQGLLAEIKDLKSAND